MAAHQRIVIFNDTHGWHSQQLSDALTGFGYEAVLADLADCRIDLSQPAGISIPGFTDTLPFAAVVRGIAPGSLEQITLRMDVLHTLRELGIPVLNPASAIELTVDKARTSLRLHQAGLPTPATFATENAQQAIQIAAREFARGHQLVIKPLFGCQGKGVALLKNLTEFQQSIPVGEVFYLQHYVPPIIDGRWQDWRLMVVNDEVIAAMSRQAGHWITNFAQGAQVFAAAVTPEMASLARAAAAAVEADYAGVDLICDKHGQFQVLEVNSVPAWKGLYQATGSDIAGALAAMIDSHIQTARQGSNSPEHAV